MKRYLFIGFIMLLLTTKIFSMNFLGRRKREKGAPTIDYDFVEEKDVHQRPHYIYTPPPPTVEGKVFAIKLHVRYLETEANREQPLALSLQQRQALEESKAILDEILRATRPPVKNSMLACFSFLFRSFQQRR